MPVPNYAAIADLEHRTGMPHSPDTEAACTDSLFHACCTANPAYGNLWRLVMLAADAGVAPDELRAAIRDLPAEVQL